MRTPKERLHRVLVVGANPAGIAAANKIGEMGIPVTLVDPDPDLDVKLADEEWRLSSGLTLNYALRPGLIRILRNPRINCHIPGEVSSIKHTPQGFAVRVKTTAVYVDAERCTLCGRCVEECPVCSTNSGQAIHYSGRRSLPGRPVIDKRRQPLCQANCPLGVNVQGYMALTRVGKFAEAYDLIRRDNVLPAICGRICTHPCEAACRRNELDQALAIRDIKRFLADYQAAAQTGNGAHQSLDSSRQAAGTAATASRSERIAVVGSGPAGLAAAADLARFGYTVTVFEKEQHPGGLLRYGIGPHRLPRDVLDSEIEHLRAMGIGFELDHAIDLPSELGELKKDYDAVLVTTGIWHDRKLGAPGEDLPGVDGCIEVLCRIYRGEITELKEKVAVIGDGNAAFDLARALVRIGAEVTIVSWFPRELIPADPDEVQGALEEGVAVIDRSRVMAFLGSDGGMTTLRCALTKPGKPDANGIPWPVVIPEEKPFDLQFDRAIVAIGQTGNLATCAEESGLTVNPAGFISVNDQCRTGMTGVYAAGDAISGPTSVVQAMASGRNAAHAMHRAISGEAAQTRFTQRPADRELADIATDVPSMARVKMPERQPATRKDSFVEVALGLNETQVRAEAERCLQCGVCSECLQCAEVCGVGAIQHQQSTSEVVEHCGVVIIADPDAAPAIKGEDILRAYSAKAAKTDVYAMMLRGFAAAAEALILLGGGSQRMRGHGLSFTPPDPQLPSDVRLGVFVCRCNDSLGWSPALDDYLAELSSDPDIEQVEVLDSACTHEGSAKILRTIREKGLTRIVLASCVCCPLDFICSTCTEQRSRLKDALFSGTGVSRNMVETCNLRGEVLRLLKDRPELAASRFSGLLERSIGRAGKLKTLPAPARPYNFTTGVLGDSAAALKSAMTLADAGMEVFLFGSPDASFSHPNIHVFSGVTVKGIRGTVGNFQILVKNEEGVEQELLVGAVILGEKSRKTIPYMPMAELPPHLVESSMQQRGSTGVPFFYPGATSIPGLFLANPAGMNVSQRVKGAAAAIMATTVMPRRPRQNKGYTVVVNKDLCRGCGRCMQVCPYQAVSFSMNEVGGWCATIDQALCKGCGNCIPVCPSNAADSPYRDRRYLEQMIEEILL
jgi:NADPH-dependent glutamate synthase beta subunit-like oxidoreductase/NAD-dependent dihydropyrimidine dehydrogenase PreA subunit